MISFIANAVVVTPEPMVSLPALGAFIGGPLLGLIALLLGSKKIASTANAAGKEAGKKEALETQTTITNQPFIVKMQEEFVTRREFDRLETIVAVNAAKSEGYIKECLAAMDVKFGIVLKTIERQNDRLTKSINSVAQTAYEGRQKIHLKVNDQGETLAKLQERVAIVSELSQVGEQIAEAIRKNA